MLLGWFANSVAWLRLGDAYRAYLYHEERRAPFVRTVGTILSERLLDITTIVLLLAASLPFLVEAGRGGAWTVAATASALLAVLGWPCCSSLSPVVAARGCFIAASRCCLTVSPAGCCSATASFGTARY